ncbi:hypothetical protein FACS1894104_1890 [Actinomycetota bacterium]|nr:hypothetical protein FACS1894104_1890 [Actinomycetota bacterium]
MHLMLPVYRSRNPSSASDAPNYIKQAYKLVDYANLNREERKMISAQERREQDLIGQMNYARNEGIAIGEQLGETKGRAEGRAEGLAKVARNLLSADMNPSEVARLTGLTEQEVNGLVNRQLN